MKKRLLLSGLVLILLASVSPIVEAVDNVSDTPTKEVSICIDGPPADLDIPAIISAVIPAANLSDISPAITSVIINNTTYVSIREFSTVMGADSVTWDNGTTTVTAPGLHVTATVGNIYLVANGRYLFVPDSCLMINNSAMVPIRTLAKAFDAQIDWDSETYTINVIKGSGAILSGSAFYNETDLHWMSRIIRAEAGGESFVGKIAVGGVIMNRIVSPEFPDTVYDVVFDRRYGIQFTPAYSGAIYTTPSEECIIAAKIALDGGNTAGESLYFASTTHCWANRNRPYAMKIGNHNFYA